MAQFVFVHGVATRPDEPGYDASVRNRDALFREVGFKGRQVEIKNAVWGDLGQAWAWGQICLPNRATRQAVESFSLGEGLGAGDGGAPDDKLGPSMAAVDFPATIDTLYAALVEEANRQGRVLSADDIADFADAADALEKGVPATVAVSTDQALIDAIRQHSPGAYGLVDKLGDALGGLVNRGRNLASQGLTDLFRDELNPTIAQFVGDVFVYLKDGDARKAIRQRVGKELREASARAKAKGESLIVMGHSMGGVILYDMLSDPKTDELPADFRVDLLATVGSQPGFFEELKLFAASSPAHSTATGQPAPLPARAGAWMNVFDPVDLLSYRCEGIFAGVKDYQFSSATGLVSAHTAYFGRPRFYERFRARVGDLGLT